jgi:DNA-directed RNA polymerase alpha subunit
MPTPEKLAKWRQIIDMRRDGCQWRTIGDSLGTSHERARQLHAEALKYFAKAETIVTDDTPIKQLLLSERLMNCLTNKGYKTFGEAKNARDADLLRQEQLGRKSLAEWRAFLQKH